MHRLRRGLLLASILVAAPLTLTLVAPQPASAQFSASIGFDSFHGQLANYGDWLYSDRWGEVWRPQSQDRDQDWRPYWAGHWAFTDEYGWTWISDEGAWGDIAYHYGRWVNDPDDGWLWLPGYVWSPAWVVWRSSGSDVGWMPMPPDDDFLRPSGISIGVSFGDWNDTGGYYGYSRWYGSRFDENRFGNLWVFVPGGRLSDPGYRRYALARPQTINIVRQSRNITNYTVVNNVIINRSVNINVVRGPNGRAPQAVRANTVLRNNRWIAPVNQGEQIQQRARQERPHGNGLANSAPPPNQQQIQSLSTRAIPVRTQNNAPGNNVPGNTPNSGPNNSPAGGSHLFNRNNAAQFTARQQAQPNAQPAQPQAQPQQAQPNPPSPQSGGNDNNRGRDNRPDNNGPGNNRPQNNGPDTRGPQAGPPPTPNNPAPAATPPNAPPERNRGFERPQQPQAPATPPSAPTPPVTREAAPVSPPAEQRGNGPDRGNRGPQQNFQRPQPETPQAAPTPPSPPREAPPQQQDRGNRPERNLDRGQQTPATAPRPQVVPERPAPPAAPPREAPKPPTPQAQPQRPPEAARPNPPADRGASDRKDQREKRDNDNK